MNRELITDTLLNVVVVAIWFSLLLVALLLAGCTTITLRTPNCEAQIAHIAGVTGTQTISTSNCWFEISG